MAKSQDLDHLKIPFEVIRLATNNFAEDIGMGGYGKVYKGQLPHPNSSGEPSTTVAVKRLDMRSGQGQREFSTEINMLASYKHSNLVSLVGFSEDGKEKVLVYKYEVNGSLDKHLASTDLTWEQRLRICIGAARGLEYLHAGVGMGHRVLHRDIKSGNILLDENWEAKISDFGLSKIGPMNQPITFLLTMPCGTLGYLDPQYHKTGILTKESDVYSFGVVLFEVLCGKPASAIYKYDGELLNNFVKHRYEEGKIDEIIMPSLREEKNMYSLQKFSDIAYQCLNKSRNQRPSMNHIVKELQSIECQVGSPTGLWGSRTGGTPWTLLLDDNMKLRKIRIDHKDWIFSIAFTVEEYLSGTLITSPHGGTGILSGRQPSEISFDADEEIIEILGSINHFPVISSLCIVTNKRRHGPFGPETGTSFSVSWDVGTFAGFYGRAGSFLDGLGFYSNKCLNESRNQHPWMKCNLQEPQSIEYQNGLPTELWGSSTGGAPWSLLLDNSQKLRKITIDHKDWIFSIAFTVEDLITGLLVSSQHGGTGIPSGVEPSEISFDAD
ncbi:putative protein kinase RLK-Pelle-CrRLK1L-1 family [Helianthus annuus]|nr:putative protein kinase RLK-Pelle-CrRLK1L-1 family [Helianthus annuus]